MKPNASLQTLLGFFSVAAACFSSGCVSTYQVKVDAIDRSKAVTENHTSYRIQDKNAVTGTHSLRYKEIAGHVKTALSAKGLYEAPDAHAADIIVEISYDIGPPRVKFLEYEQPILACPAGPRDITADTPQVVGREVVGYAEMACPMVVREKHMTICARENIRGVGRQPAEEIWRVDVSIENESQDLRGHLPILASVAMDHIGKNTNGAVALTLRADAEAIRFVRTGL